MQKYPYNRSLKKIKYKPLRAKSRKEVKSNEFEGFMHYNNLIYMYI